MDFRIPPETEAAMDRARALGADLNDDLIARDADGAADTGPWRAAWDKLATHGMIGLAIPKALGGSGHDALTTTLILEALGEGCRDNGLLLALNGQIWTMQQTVMEFGTETQQQALLPDVVAGRLVLADGITEPQGGSDAMAMRTTALRDGDDYIVNGEKTWIGMAPVADRLILFAKTAPDAGAWGVSAFLVDMAQSGITRTAPIGKMGLRTVPTSGIVFEDLRIPETARLGPEGAGGSIFARKMDWERRLIFASHVGAMRRQLTDATAYAQERISFGKPIIQHQSVANRLAEMRVRYETSRTLLHRAAWEMSQGVKDGGLMGAMTKLHISEAFLANSEDAVRVMGGNGYRIDHEAERDLRDAMGGVLYAGTSDIQKMIIARLMASEGRG